MPNYEYPLSCESFYSVNLPDFFEYLTNNKEEAEQAGLSQAGYYGSNRCIWLAADILSTG